MKRKPLLIIVSSIVLIALMTAGSLQKGASKHAKDTNNHVGTWKLELFKYGSQTSDFNKRPGSQPRIKLITDTHFTWVTIDSVSGKVIGSAGGRYQLIGNSYAELIEFGYAMDSYLGTTNTYTIKVEGDMLFLSGNLTGYGKIEEIWHRVK